MSAFIRDDGAITITPEDESKTSLRWLYQTGGFGFIHKKSDEHHKRLIQNI